MYMPFLVTISLPVLTTALLHAYVILVVQGFELGRVGRILKAEWEKVIKILSYYPPQ